MTTTKPHPAVSEHEMGRVAVKLFFGIAEEWDLTEEQRCTLAGIGTRTTLHNWRKKLDAGDTIKLSKDTLERLSYMAGIYKALQLLFTDPNQWKGWIRKPNRDFGGHSALDRILAGRVIDLADVRRYLDGWRESIMRKVDVNNDSYRLIPSHFPPISLFENLLDPKELEAAYLLESMTNDRLQDQAGNIALVAPEDRVTGPGTTVIMAAFTHIGANSRFTKGRYGVYYAGLDLDTAIIESAFSRSRLMRATDEGPQVLTMRCYKCSVNARLVDVRRDIAAHNPDSFDYAQSIGEQLRQRNEAGILYKSVRNPGGECIAAFRPTTLVPPAIQTGHFQFHWNGQTITDIMKIEKYK